MSCLQVRSSSFKYFNFYHVAFSFLRHIPLVCTGWSFFITKFSGQRSQILCFHLISGKPSIDKILLQPRLIVVSRLMLRRIGWNHLKLLFFCKNLKIFANQAPRALYLASGLPFWTSCRFLFLGTTFSCLKALDYIQLDKHSKLAIDYNLFYTIWLIHYLESNLAVHLLISHC